MISSRPIQYCELCDRMIVVTPDGRGFPPDIAKRKLVKICNSFGCPCKPKCRAGLALAMPPVID